MSAKPVKVFTTCASWLDIFDSVNMALVCPAAISVCILLISLFLKEMVSRSCQFLTLAFIPPVDGMFSCSLPALIQSWLSLLWPKY